jgi:hypothetical membrane protein
MRLETRSAPASFFPQRLGAVFWLVGIAVYFAVHLFVESAWTRPYSWSLNNISDLGNVKCGAWGDDARYVCSPLHAWMNAAFLIHGAMTALGFVLTWRWWRTGIASTASRSLMMLAGIGFMLAGFAPADTNENLHVLGALMIFLLGNIGLMLAWHSVPMSLAPRVRFYPLVLGCAGLIAMMLFAGKHDLGFGPGGMERLVVSPLQLFTLTAGIFVLTRAN